MKLADDAKKKIPQSAQRCECRMILFDSIDLILLMKVNRFCLLPIKLFVR